MFYIGDPYWVTELEALGVVWAGVTSNTTCMVTIAISSLTMKHEVLA